jgi:hypothetical protein
MEISGERFGLPTPGSDVTIVSRFDSSRRLPMFSGVLAFSALMLPAESIELPRDTIELRMERFAIPVNVQENASKQLDGIRLLVSSDQGKTWKLHMTGPAESQPIKFVAPRDGLYWFAMQTIDRDGSFSPRDPQPDLKVYINTAGRKIKMRD